MKYICICLVVLALLMGFASCGDNSSKDDDVTLPASVATIPTETTIETTEETTPQETTPALTTPAETTPAITEPDFENNPDPDGTKRY